VSTSIENVLSGWLVTAKNGFSVMCAYSSVFISASRSMGAAVGAGASGRLIAFGAERATCAPPKRPLPEAADSPPPPTPVPLRPRLVELPLGLAGAAVALAASCFFSAGASATAGAGDASGAGTSGRAARTGASLRATAVSCGASAGDAGREQAAASSESATRPTPGPRKRAKIPDRDSTAAIRNLQKTRCGNFRRLQTLKVLPILQRKISTG